MPRRYTFDSVCKALVKIDKAEIDKMHATKVCTMNRS